MSTRVLVADDEGLIRQSLRSALASEGFEVSVAASGEEAWARFAAERPDVVLLDLVLGDTHGLDLLRKMKAEAPETKVLVITAFGTIRTAVDAMKLGGYDFIKKPFELEEILAAVRNAARTASLERQVEYLAGRERRRAEPAGLVAVSEPMRRLLDQVHLVARSPVPTVLVLGESGTGKQLVARLLHEASAHAGGPFVELNCSTIPENLVESELFGHERGAFSGAGERKPGLVEVADGGTLFLDEVGDLGTAAQAKLLTFLEQRTFRRVGGTAVRRVEERVVAATHRDLKAMVGERRFREDLWYRLDAITVRVPPLREHVADVEPLAAQALEESSRSFGRRWRGLSSETVALLSRYPWPGNVRELRAVIARAALLHDEELLQPAHLPPELLAAALATPEAAAGGAGPIGAIPSLAEVELAHIRRVLELCGGNRTHAAQLLGITRQTLARRVGGGE